MLIAKWQNGLGEDCESKVYAEFKDEFCRADRVVVWNVRQRDYEVRANTDCEFEVRE